MDGINQIIYFEKKGKTVNLDKENMVKEAKEKLQDSLKKTLSNEAKIIDNKISVEDVKEGKIIVKVIFTVEQDIAQNIS